MKILTAAQMRAVDQVCIERYGIPGLTLMENASLQVYSAIAARYPALNRIKVTVVCGKGNNGGDGLATARHIATRGGAVRAILLATASDVHGDARANLEMMMAVGVEVSEATDKASWRRAWTEEHSDLVVDGIFGTGLASPPAGLHALVIDDINASGTDVVSIDVPSGLSSDSGDVSGPAIRAKVTVALQCLKMCHVFPEASVHCGEVVVVAIGMPPDAVESAEHRVEMLDAGVGSLLRPRNRDSHKGSYGHALVVAGSIGKTGAAVMSGMGALRVGTGLVTVATPRTCLPIVAAGAPEIMTEPLDETEAHSIASQTVDHVRAMGRGKDALIIGPGLSTHPATAEAVRAIVRNRALPTVLDADGLNCFAGGIDQLKAPVGAPPLVLTPHPGELARLVGSTVGEILRNRLEIACRTATDLRVHVVLKGYRTIIATPDGRAYVNPTGNPGMATGGTGDVLAGMMGGLIAQGHDLPGAVNLAVYLHGLAGDLAAAEIGEIPLVATDLLRFLPAAFKRLSALTA